MFPSSSRVKLNRVALKNVIGLKLVPRRRRVPTSQNNVPALSPKQEENYLVSELVSVKDTASTPSSNEPVQTFFTDQMGPENVTDTARAIPEGQPEENCVGTQKAKRRKNEPSNENASKEVKQEGPCTRGKYQQSKLNTRSKSRLDYLRKLCNLSLRFTWCLCTAPGSVQKLLKQAKVHGRVKPRSKMSCRIELSSEPLVTTKAPKSQTVSDLKPGMSKSSCRSKPRNGNIKRKTRVTHVAEGGRERRVQSKVKARSAGCDPQPVAADKGQVPAGTIPSGLSSKVHFSSVVFLRSVS